MCAQELRLPQMVEDNEDPKMTAFTVSVDAKLGTSTGISAGDRAITLRSLADSKVWVSPCCVPLYVYALYFKLLFSPLVYLSRPPSIIIVAVVQLCHPAMTCSLSLNVQCRSRLKVPRVYRTKLEQHLGTPGCPNIDIWYVLSMSHPQLRLV